VALYIKSAERKKKYADKNTPSSKAIIQNRRRDIEFPRQAKVEGIHDY